MQHLINVEGSNNYTSNLASQGGGGGGGERDLQ